MVYNIGDRNSGDLNSGDLNSGNWNSGDLNSGDLNSGDLNSGDRNSGDLNSGDLNSGDLNSGDRNSGNWNSGNWNSGDRNSGLFNTNAPKLRIFNKNTDYTYSDINSKFIIPKYLYFDLVVWKWEDDMTIDEKNKYPNYKVLGGWLFSYDYKDACINSFNTECDKEQAQQTINLPNFDYAIFEEITGITKEMLDNKLGNNKNIKVNPPEIIFESGVKYRRVD